MRHGLSVRSPYLDKLFEKIAATLLDYLGDRLLYIYIMQEHVGHYLVKSTCASIMKQFRLTLTFTLSPPVLSLRFLRWLNEELELSTLAADTSPDPCA